VVSEVGRQPWIVYELMRVEDAATTNTGIWVTTILVTVLYLALGVTTVLILRGMARRYRRQQGADEVDDDVPYGPSGPPSESSAPEPVAT
jgi:cytochrome d ubiquinol oxidase subunit I